jgi:Spy/CpxP family protein refolding chaperone
MAQSRGHVSLKGENNMKLTMKRNLLSFAAIGVIALGGFAVAQAKGDFGGAGGGFHGMHGHGFALQRLTKSLDLTSDQQAKVQPIIDQARPQIIAIHKDAMEKTQTVISNAASQIRPLLNADQQKKFDAVQKAHQDMINAIKELHAAQAE